MKRTSKIKRLVSLGLIFLMSINSFAAIVSDNDGSAFVTKAEFDALKSSFNQQIDDYNLSIDNKIDGAIASYLAGIRTTETIILEPNIRDFTSVEWRDTLVRIGTVRKWSAASTYADTANYVWQATYDTVLKAGRNGAPSVVNQKCELVWLANGPQGHGGSVLSMFGKFDGGDYWKCCQWNKNGTTFDAPNFPLIRYHKNPYGDDVEHQQILAGWFDYGINFANAYSAELDNSTVDTPPAGHNATCAMNYGFNNPSTVYNYAYADDAGSGRNTNCWGIKVAQSETALATTNYGWRPTKESTIIFCCGNAYDCNGQNRNATNCNGYTTVPTTTYFPCITTGENNGTVTNDPLHMMLLGDTNTQEVNYIITREDTANWNTRIEWPDDCYKDFTLTDIVLRKVPINEHPGGTGNDWDTNRYEDYVNDDAWTKKYAWSFEKVPATLTVSLPTKPHKKLKLLDSNFISKDGTRYITFGEGMCITDAAPTKGEITLEFEVQTNSNFNANGCKATIELCKQSFNDTGTPEYHVVKSGATRLSSGSTKWLIDTTRKNSIKLDVKMDDKLFIRFSPNDKSLTTAGQNYVKLKNLSAICIKE